MDHDIRKAMQSIGARVTEPSLLTQLAAAAEQHGLSARELADRYDVFLLNRDDARGSSKVSTELIEAFSARLQRDCNKENWQQQRLGAPSKKGARPWEELSHAIATPQAGRAPPSTPLTATAAGNTKQPLTPLSLPRSAFKSRNSKAQVVSVLNDHVPRAEAQQGQRVVLQVHGGQLPARHTYMMERLEDKVAAINSRMLDFKAWLKQRLGAQYSVPVPVHLPVQDESLYIGRIICDSEGQLNDQSVMLEGDITTSEGQRTTLDLSGVPAFRLFPGQIVAVRGLNPTGSRIMARGMWTHLPPAPRPAPLTATPMDVDGAATTSSSSGPLSMVVACGPFTTNEDLSYEPLGELLSQCSGTGRPDVLLLLGPFVDVEHPEVANGMLDVTFEQLLHMQVLTRLKSWSEGAGKGCQVALMPAVRDVTHHPTFPQPPLDLPSSTSGQELLSLQNPSSFAAGPCLVSCCCQDVLRHLSGGELQRGPSTDRLAALASHVLGQRSFYPVYPAQATTCLDTTGDYALRIPELPDVLLLPSDLAPFAKLVSPQGPTGAADGNGAVSAAGPTQQVVCINPGRLCKGASGGTYARITTLKQQPDVSSANSCRVEIIRV